MSEWAGILKDKNKDIYYVEAEKLKSLMNDRLWNDSKGWFENLYPDGTKEAIWTSHLFDALGTDYLSGGQVNKIVSHLREGVFLGKFGIYSIARNDTVHWDLIDSDWGGGGQYAGAPGRLSRYLYKQGFAEMGWEILQRHMRYIEFFPYLPQNPRTDAPIQDRSSMPVEIASGAGMEAIIFGLFGITAEKGRLTIKPNMHEELGETTLYNFNFRSQSYDIRLTRNDFSVFRGGKLVAVRKYGQSVIFNY
jgi:hypothetical protein